MPWTIASTTRSGEPTLLEIAVSRDFRPDGVSVRVLLARASIPVAVAVTLVVLRAQLLWRYVQILGTRSAVVNLGRSAGATWLIYCRAILLDYD
jgi:hypothetical protein